MINLANFIAGQEWIFLIIIGIVVLVIIASVVVGLVRRNNSTITVREESKDTSQINKEQNSNSLKILKERLAKGEITKDEFNKLKSEFE